MKRRSIKLLAVAALAVAVILFDAGAGRCQAPTLERTLTVGSLVGGTLSGVGSNRFVGASLGRPSMGQLKGQFKSYTVAFEVVDVLERVVTTVVVPVGQLVAARSNELLVEPTVVLHARAILVLYRPEERRVGVILHNSVGGGIERAFYVECDSQDGHLLEWIPLVETAANETFADLGVDPSGAVLDFYVERYAPLPPGGLMGRAPHVSALGGPKQLIVQRLVISKKRIETIATIPLPGRSAGAGSAGRLYATPSDDHQWFAFAEYWERQMAKLLPRPSLFVVDAARRSAFEVAAQPTSYGAAFDRQGRYLYVGSNQLGTIQRIDLRKQRIDLTIQGPLHIHRLVVSTSGRLLYVLASRTEVFEAWTLPDLASAKRTRLLPPLDVALATFFGSSVRETPDGRHLVMGGPPRRNVRDANTLHVARLPE